MDWITSSFCKADSPQCVQVAQDAHTVSVRDSKNVVSPWLVFTHAEWQSFVDGVRAGEFDLRPAKATASA